MLFGVFALTLVFPLLQVLAIPTPRDDSGPSVCSATQGDYFCCQQVIDASSPDVFPLLYAAGQTEPDVTGPVGLGCTSMSRNSGESCAVHDSAPVPLCCQVIDNGPAHVAWHCTLPKSLQSRSPDDQQNDSETNVPESDGPDSDHSDQDNNSNPDVPETDNSDPDHPESDNSDDSNTDHPASDDSDPNHPDSEESDDSDPDHPDSDDSDPDHPDSDDSDPDHPDLDDSDPDHPDSDDSDPNHPDTDVSDPDHPNSADSDKNHSDKNHSDKNHSDKNHSDKNHTDSDHSKSNDPKKIPINYPWWYNFFPWMWVGNELVKDYEYTPGAKHQ